MQEDDGGASVLIVFDGPASAGKTSNLRRLAESTDASRRSALVTPAEDEGETLFFDWLKLDDVGDVDERKTTALLVAVPGHGTFRPRRRALLALADVVVFVVESTADRVRWAVPMFRELSARFGADTAERVVLQANKQDLDGALPPGEVGRLLSPRLPMVGACAKTGTGVPETLATAVEAALRHRRTRARAAPSPRDPDELMQYLAATTEKMGDKRKTLVPGGPAAPPPPSSPVSAPRSLRRPSGTAITPLFPPKSTPPPPEDGEDARPTEPLRSASGEVPVQLAVPTGEEPTNQLWPALKARQWIKSLERPQHFTKLPNGDIEGVVDEAMFRTRESWRFDDAEAGRRAMQERAQAAVKLGERGPAKQALALVDDGERGFRLWLVLATAPRLTDRLRDAEGRRDEMGTAAMLIQLVGTYLQVLRLHEEEGLTLAPDVHNYAVVDGTFRYVGTVCQLDGEPPSLTRAARTTLHSISPTIRPQWLDGLAGALANAPEALHARLGLKTPVNRDAIQRWLRGETAQEVS